MYSFTFGCNDVAIKVETNSRQLLQDLYVLYGEYYCDSATANTTIRYIEGLIDEDVLSSYQIADRENEYETYNYLNYDNHVLTVNLDHYDISKVQFMQRILINTFVMELQKRGYIIVHGACVAKDGQGYIISGNKGAGKTTTLLKMLELGYDFVSNDKVAIKKINGEIVACGIPHSMGIIASDISRFNIDAQYGRYEGPKIYFRVAQIGKALGVNVYNKTNLRAIIFPSYEPGRQELSSSIVPSTRESYGSENIFEETAIAEQKQYLLDIFPKISYVNPDVLDEVHGYKVVQGESTFEQLDEFIQGMNTRNYNKIHRLVKNNVYNNNSNI